MRRLLLRLLLSAGIICLNSCLPNTQYRKGAEAVERPAPNAGRNYALGYIEFDEQGDFWDRAQLGQAVDLIKQTTRPLLVIYVHGWQNNASPATGDVPQFHRVLEKLAATGPAKELHYEVVGVYLGWRGKQAYDPFLKILSFPTRKAAATRLGSSNTITEAIFRLVYEARHRPERARTILIGHSFGALVVERAVEQAMTGGILTGQPVVPADFILLVNSAAESIYAKEMRDMISATLSFASAQRCYRAQDQSECFMKDEPRIISVTSETDSATGVAFPIGASLFGVGKLYRQYPAEQTGSRPVNQRLFFTHTPGHNELLLDHAIAPLTTPSPSPKFPNAFDENLRNPQALPPMGADDQATPIFATGGEAVRNGKITPWHWWRLNYTGNPERRSPFWIVKVPKEILNGHGDIFNPNARDMMAALFRLSNVLDKADEAPPPIGIQSRPQPVGQPLVTATTLAAPLATPAPNEKMTATTASSAKRARRSARKKRKASPELLQLQGRQVVRKSAKTKTPDRDQSR